MAKRKAKRKSKLAKGCCDTVPMRSEREHRSVTVRKIANGYLVDQSTSGPEGYKSEETYVAKKPKIEMQIKQAKAREKRLEKVKI